jgi:hypothetical protein
MNKDFWFPINARELLTDAKFRALTPTRRAYLLDLWCHCCIEGGIPAEPKEQAKLLGIRPADWDRLRGFVADFFVERVTEIRRKSDENPSEMRRIFVSPRMEADRQKRAEKVEKLALNGRKGGKASAAQRKQMLNQSQSQSINTSTNVDVSPGGEPPTPAPTLLPDPPPPQEPTPSDPKAALVIDTWNRETGGKLAKARLTKDRAKVIATRLKEPGWFAEFEIACRHMAADPRFQGNNNTNWQADLDWTLKAGKATQVAERAAQAAQHPNAEVTHGTNQPGNRPSANSERVAGNKAALEAMLTRRGICRTIPAHGTDGRTLPAPGSPGVDGRVHDRPGATGGQVLAFGRV